jgi:hypothetical protein
MPEKTVRVGFHVLLVQDIFTVTFIDVIINHVNRYLHFFHAFGNLLNPVVLQTLQLLCDYKRLSDLSQRNVSKYHF